MQVGTWDWIRNRAPLPSWVSGYGTSMIRNIVNSGGTYAVSCVGDSKTETVNPNAGTAATNPIREIWSAQLQEVLNQNGVQIIDVPTTYNPGTGNTLNTGVTASGSVTHTNPKLSVLATATTGAVAYFFPQGLNHVAVMLGVGPNNFSSARVSVYTGNVTGAIPSAGTTTNRVADWITDQNAGIAGADSSWFLASLRVNSWADNIIQKDSAQVAQENLNNVIVQIAENTDMGVSGGTGCTVVVYNTGAVQTGLHRILGKLGGTSFRDGLRAVMNNGSFGMLANRYRDATAAASDTDYYGSTVGINRFGEITARYLYSQQPKFFGTDNKVGDLAKGCQFDNVIVTYSMYTNRGTEPAFSTITSGQIDTEVAATVALCDFLNTYGIPFVFFELMAINGDAGYRDYMAAMKAAIEARPNGVWCSVADYMQAKFGLTATQSRTRANVETALGSAAIDSADGSDFHTNRYGQHLEAEAIKGLFQWAMM